MTRSLADLRANPPKFRTERSETICLAPHLVAEIQSLTQELDEIPSLTSVDVEGERTGPPRKIGQGENPRATEIRVRLAELLAEMAEHEGELRLRATSDGEWRRWVNSNPARPDSDPGHNRDKEVTGGFCNADALIEALGTYAFSWNGERLADGDWAMLSGSVAGPDLKAIARSVTSMHESRLDFRQWRSNLSESLRELNASVSLETSGSVPADSLVGNPSQSSEATTGTAIK